VPDPPETDLPLDAVVIRGGVDTCTPLALYAAFLAHYETRHDEDTGECWPEPDGRPHYCYALSVNSVPGLDVDGIAKRAKLLNGKVRPSTVEAIVNTGLSMSSTPGRQDRDGHCDVHVPGTGATLPTQKHLEALERAFGDAVDNAGKE
jgi:hypothetical protein